MDDKQDIIEERRISIKAIIFQIIFLALVVFVCFYEFPYYIDKPGGLDNINNRVKVDGAYESTGSINMTYVGEVKGTLPFLIYAYFNPDWTIIPKSNENIGTLNYETSMLRERVLMKQSYTTAIKYAYEKAQKDITVIQENCYPIYILEEAKTDLEVGDQILSIDGEKITTKEQLAEIIDNKAIGSTSSIEVLRNGKEYTRTVEYIDDGDGLPAIGIQLGVEYLLETNPKYDFSYNSYEYGPSGGLMITLAVYNSLVKEDITGGKKIAGTGTLEIDGSVGPVGGIEYKLKGAVKGHADVFLAPSEENYDEAVKLKEKNGYDITIVKVSTFDEALEYLENNVMKK